MAFRYGIIGYNGPRRPKQKVIVNEVSVEDVPVVEETPIEVIIEEKVEVVFDELDEKHEEFMVVLSAREEELKLKEVTKPKKKKRKYTKRKKKS